ncbi:MAG: Gfo/Idh/MocA family protein [Dehalococcoidia bacterium]
MAAPVRYGVIGAGLMGREHLRNLAQIAEATVVAVADPVEASRAAAAADAPGAVLFEGYQALLARDDIDAVVVATPNHTHAGVLPDCFATGKHILVEKPLATTIADCEAIVRAAAGREAVTWVGMEYRYMAPVARLIEEVRAGTAGQLWMLAIREHRFPFLPKVGHWNRFNRNTGGTLVEKCCHFFDLMRVIVGAEPERVFASGGQDVNHLKERYGGETPDILDNALVVVEFANGVRASLDLCMFAEGSKHQEEIAATGDRGKVECFLPASTLVVAPRRGDLREEAVAPNPRVRFEGFHHGSSYLEHLAFIRAIRGEGPVEVTPADGLRAVAMGIAAQRSIAERRVVEMAEVLPAGW